MTYYYSNRYQQNGFTKFESLAFPDLQSLRKYVDRFIRNFFLGSSFDIQIYSYPDKWEMYRWNYNQTRIQCTMWQNGHLVSNYEFLKK